MVSGPSKGMRMPKKKFKPAGVAKDLADLKAFLSGRTRKLPNWRAEDWVRPLKPKDLTRLRRSYGLRLKPWADLLGEPESAMRAWERGTEIPPGAASFFFRVLETESGPMIMRGLEALRDE